MPKPPIDPAKVLALVQKRRNYRLAGQDRLRIEAKLPDVRERVVRVYRIGEAAPRLAEAWMGVPGEDCASLERAVEQAAAQARPGEVVLLAPGCASFDMFRDFEDRGQQFRILARALPGATPAGADPAAREEGR